MRLVLYTEPLCIDAKRLKLLVLNFKVYLIDKINIYPLFNSPVLCNLTNDVGVSDGVGDHRGDGMGHRVGNGNSRAGYDTGNRVGNGMSKGGVGDSMSSTNNVRV